MRREPFQADPSQTEPLQHERIEPGMRQARRPEPPPRPRVAAGRLWGGGVATAVVAAMVALVGVMASRWLLNIPILAPRQDGAYGNATTTTLVLATAAVALLATAIVHLLMLSTPRPAAFFGWIIALATVLAVLLTFRTGAPLSERIATSVLYVVIGIAIGTLLSGVADRSIILTPPPHHPADADY
jgi:uncharacterized protein DUF6069